MALGRVRRRRMIVAVLALAVVMVTCAGCTSLGGPEAVQAPAGSVRGDDDGMARQYLGIRYAMAPVGPLRWAPPVPAPPATGTVDATERGPSCPQSPTSATADTADQNEDCLFLNVTTPSDVRPGERLPVFVWWHGGGFLNGTAATIDARRLAEQGRIAVVTANYRLGTLGYLGLPGLDGSGAFGFADQVQSLRWTRENIAAFGGDPDNITVAGQSAGAAAACALLTSPALTELQVKHVIVMSGACSTRFPANGLALRQPARDLYTTTPAAQAAGVAAAGALGCPPAGALDCLRRQPVSALTGQNGRFGALAWGGDLLPSDPATSVRTVPPSVSVLYGGTRDEARAFFELAVRINPATLSPAAYDGLLGTAFGADADRVRQQYPISRYRNSGGLAWSAVVTDASWACGVRRDVAALADAGVPTYAYETSRPDGPTAPDGFPEGGAPHASDLRLLFGSPQDVAADEEALDRLTVQYWSSFARTGRPQADSGPVWQPVPAGGPVRPLQIDPTSVRPVDTGAIHRCDFWSTVRY